MKLIATLLTVFVAGIAQAGTLSVHAGGTLVCKGERTVTKLSINEKGKNHFVDISGRDTSTKTNNCRCRVFLGPDLDRYYGFVKLAQDDTVDIKCVKPDASPDVNHVKIVIEESSTTNGRVEFHHRQR